MLAPGECSDVRKTLVALGSAALTLIVLSGCEVRVDRQGEEAATGSKASSTAPADRVARGAYLVRVGVCNECHTPWTMTSTGPAPDTTRLLAGHPAAMVLPSPPASDGGWIMSVAGTNTAFAGPWGVSYAPNLTSHTTGLSAWNEEIFIRALRTGRHMGTSRPILPPMPWPSYRHMTDEDLKAMWAYLQSIPPIENQAPDPVISEAMMPGATSGGSPGTD